MIEELWKNSAIIAKRNVDSNQIPISVPLIEYKQIIDVHSCIVLNQLPDENVGINIEGFNEVFDIEDITTKSFKVDYSNGVIYFHPYNIGKRLSVSYSGTGCTLLSASRIYTKYDKNGNVLETLEELLDEAKLQLKAIESLGGAVEVINKLDVDIESGLELDKELKEDIQIGTQVKNELVEKTNIANTTINTLVEKTNKGNEIISQLDKSSVTATQKKKELDQSITSATETNTILTNTNETANQTNLTLEQTMAEAQNDINTINSTGNKSLTIGASQFINNEYTWTHNMNSENLTVNIIDVPTKEPLNPDYKIVDKNNILIRNSAEHPNVKVVLSASYYQGNSLFGTNVEEFADDSVGVNEKSVRLKDDNGAYQNPVTNSDSVFMADGKTKLTKKVDDIDGSILNINNYNQIQDSNMINILMCDGSTLPEKLKNAIILAIAKGYKKIFIPVGEYMLTEPLSLPQSPNKIIIEGENIQNTIITGEIAELIKLKGGSGNLSTGYLSNLTLKGNGTNIGVKLEDICGYKIKNVRFDNLETGIQAYNNDGFTEYNLAESCEFTSTVKKVIEYKRSLTSTHESFHGTGLFGCLINQSNTTVASIIVNENCLIYNAPLDFTIWTHDNPRTLIQFNGDNRSYVYGNIRIESFNYNQFSIVDGNELTFVGNINGFGSNYDARKLIQCKNVRITNLGGVDRYNEIINGKLNVHQGNNTVRSCNKDYMVNYQMIGEFYRQCGTVIVGKNPQSDELTISELQMHSFFDQLSKGKCTFSNDGNNLVLNCPNLVNSLYLDYTMTSLK